MPNDGRRFDVIVVALFVGAALLTQRSLVGVLGSGIYDQDVVVGNDAILHAWVLAWAQHALWTQPLAPFDANIFWPNSGTALYTDHLLGLAVLLSPLRLFTDNVVFVHNVATLLAPAVNAFVVYVLARDVLGSRTAAVIAGAAYGFAPLRFLYDRHQIQMLVAWWMPLVLLAGGRALRTGRWRWAALAGVALAFQGWTAIYLLALFAPFVAAAHVWWFVAYPPAAHATGWRRLLTAEVVGALLTLPSLMAYRAVQSGLDTTRSVVINGLLSVVPSMAATLVPSATLVVACCACVIGWRRLDRAPRIALGLYVLIAFGALACALGPSIALPGDLGAIRGPYALLAGLPGYDALRAPGRMLHVAMLGFALLAGAGVRALQLLMSGGARRAVVLAVGLLLAWDCRTPWYPTIPLASPPRSPSHRWLAAQPGDVRALYVPIRNDQGLEQRWQFASTASWVPIVNGNMGVVPPTHAYFVRRMAEAPMDDVLSDLALIGVTHVVVHEAMLTEKQRAKITAARDMDEVHRVGRTVIYAVRAAPTSPREAREPVSREGWSVTASENADDAALVIDGDAGTAWRSWRGLERTLAGWRQQQSVQELFAAFLERQPSRVEIDFGGARSVRAVRLVLDGSDPMMASLLRFRTSLDGRRWVPARGVLVGDPDVRALVADRGEQRYAFVMEQPTMARHLRVAGHGLDWSLGELDVE